MASSVVEVVVEIVGRPGPYRYRWPEELGAPALGDEVIVGLQARRIAAWVTAITVDDDTSELKEVLRRRRPAVSRRAFELSLLAARWYVCSPVYFLRKTRSRRIRDAAAVAVALGERQAAMVGHADPSRQDGAHGSPVGTSPVGTSPALTSPVLTDSACGRSTRGGSDDRAGASAGTGATDLGREPMSPLWYGDLRDALPWPVALAPMDLIWHAMGASSIETALTYVRERSGANGIIVCPTQRQRERMLLALIREGHKAGDAEADWSKVALGEIDVVVGSRFAAFAPLAAVDYLIVLDPVDPSMREQSSPYAGGLEVARLRGSLEGIRVTVITAAPPLGVAATAKVYREPFRIEAQRWPRFDVIRTAELDPSRGVVGAILDRGLGRDPSRRLVVIVPSAGWRGWLRCQSCQTLQRCPKCRVPLSPLHLEVERPGMNERLRLIRQGMVADAMWCSGCRERFPLRCLECGGHRVALSSLSAERVRSLLAGATSAPVEVITGDDDPSPDWRIVVGGYGLLDRIDKCDVVALLNVESFHGVSSLEGLALTLYYCNRGAALAEHALLFTDGGDDDLLAGLESRQLRPLYRRELASRQRLGLPPSYSIVRMSGLRARALVDAQPSELFEGVEVIVESDSSCLFVAPMGIDLHERLEQANWPTDSRSCRFCFDPLEL
ncbi:hypothetical protein [Ferrimicrobium sp.]|uniref:primosomal protein N' family DNA-binding protein n=1 Tax=Ferrimicrobium sp. TaxID=2926050 RepID=UPI002607BC6D|nr:hypothetical protein [Ferrimicrobium sp.]